MTRPDHNDTLEAEIARLDGLGLDELRKLWGQWFGEVPAHHSANLLRRRLGYELQARAYGGPPAETGRRLKRLHEAFKANPAFALTPPSHTEAGHSAESQLAWRAASSGSHKRGF
jgi:Protein of unknown function (DUF2924)